MDMDMSGGDHNSMAPNSSMGDMPMPMDMMPMYFYFGIPSSDILFKGWLPINDWRELIALRFLIVLNEKLLVCEIRNRALVSRALLRGNVLRVAQELSTELAQASFFDD